MAGQHARHFHGPHPARFIQRLHRRARQGAQGGIADRPQHREGHATRCCHFRHHATFQIDRRCPMAAPKTRLLGRLGDHVLAR